MIPRWDSVLNDIKVFLKRLNKLLPKKLKKSKRGRPPKHSIRSYLKLIITKEYKKVGRQNQWVLTK